jgi:hypothetical protein
MKYKIRFVLFFSMLSASIFGQDKDQVQKGAISFVTSKNVYVKFANTELIKVGDTLQVSSTKKPCLLVNNKSSSSVVCLILFGCDIKKGDEVVHTTIKNKEVIKKMDIKEQIIANDQITATKKKSIYDERIRGNVSVASYNTLSSIREDRNRIASRFSLNAQHIDNSKISFDSYVNYQQNFNNQKSTGPDKVGDFRVYNLAVQFDATPTLSVVAGRKINPKTSSLGAIDGLQIEKYFNHNYVGAIAGFRPDFFDYNFNSNLLEYGAYYGRKTEAKNFYSETTLGALEQRNGSEIDRRYAYFQHASTLFKKLNIFSSLEFDFYNKINNVVGSNLRLTNLYASARYRFNRDFNATLSYDSRKRILYYETFQTEIERMLDDDIARQGIRVRLNARISEFVNTGVSYSKRFQSDRDNKSDNIYFYLGIPKLPGIGGRVSLNYNVNTSNFLNSNILSLRHSRDFFNDQLNAEFYYRLADYTYVSSNTALNRNNPTQSYYGTNLSYRFSRRLTFSVSGELSTNGVENNYRIYTRLIKRFYKNKNK